VGTVEASLKPTTKARRALESWENSGEVFRARALAAELALFSSRAGHDLLGPVNQAGSLLALFIKRNRTSVDSDGDLLLDFLKTAAARMEYVMRGMDQYLEVAGTPTLREPLDMNAPVASCLESLQKGAIATTAGITSDSLPVVSADAKQMFRMFEVLIGNAIKFRKPSEPPRIHISSVRAGDHWQFSVEDNGIGIAPEHRESVLLPFKRLHGKEYPGAGLGLAVAKLIAGQHGGTVWIDSVSRAGLASETVVSFTVSEPPGGLPALADSV
jgi:light-regulated signal transduction histidine kinase (bacteriophytochrome)